MISFFSGKREFLTINITRKDMRIYVHPPAGAYFDADDKFKVEKFRFRDGSFNKTTGKYRALSFWISDKKYLTAAGKIINMIPKSEP